MVILREGECPGLTAEVIQALRSQNVRTVVDLVSSDIEELARKCALSYKTLVAVKRVLLAQYTAFPTNGADLYEELLSSTAILSTGNPSLDKLLDSGLYTGEVTELIGAPGSGKTQVCLGVAVSVACDLKRNILYIDSTGGLSASRLLQMMEALRRIQVRQVFSVFSLFEAQQDLRSSGFHQVAGGSGSVKVVIVDSVAAVLSPIIGSRQTEGLSLMMQLAGELRTMARDLGVAVLVTNHMTRDGNGVVKAGLGRSWSHVPRTRVLLQRVEREGAKPSGLRTATLVKSSRQPSQISQEFDLGACNQPQDLLPAPRANPCSELFPSLGSRALITSNSLNRCYRLMTQRGRADYGQDLALGKSTFTTTEKTSLNITMTPAEMVLATEKEPENTQTTAYFSLEPTASSVSPAQEKTPDWAEQTSVSISLKLSMEMKHLQEPTLNLPEKSQTTPSLSPEPASSTISTAQKKTSDWAEESISTSVKLSLEMEDLQPVASTPISAPDWTTTTSLNLSFTETLSVPEENSPPSSVGLNDIIPTHEPMLASKPDLQ
ncbi:DNA repair protein RAD51-like 4 [Acipenser ruthenus]|uniref:DNA repair protein RAD51-like 4 n=1 Tax=Acipenser ruthenus TaxID=7906 RepID=A0A662YTT1_ACIRT|nr:DNA repair protein RAD51-like 4 [Acipenser ruthenus]